MAIEDASKDLGGDDDASQHDEAEKKEPGPGF